MLLSTFLFAYVVGNFCIIIDGLQARSFTFQNYMDQLNDFMDLEAVPVTLRAWQGIKPTIDSNTLKFTTIKSTS